MGVSGTAAAAALRVLVGLISKDAAYERVQRKIAPRLYRQYHPLLLALKQKHTAEDYPHTHCGRIWFCWLQGMEQAPRFIKVCLRSIQTNIPEREVTLITLANYQEYVSLPADLVEKYRRGLIPDALFSDLLRVSLLCEHGGTWMDASILCTGHNFPSRVFDCDLFLFQTLTKGEYRFRGISNWFITAYSHNPLLLVLRDMLYQYWRDHDCALNYYIFHQFFAWIAVEFPEEVAAMPRGNRLPPLRLGARLGDLYDADWWNELTSYCAFHKTNHRVAERVKSRPDTFYAHIVETYADE